MLWGSPAPPSSNKQAVKIGQGAVSLMNCRTGQFGFLALGPRIYRDKPPPLKIWFKSKTAISKVETFYGFHNFLDSTCEMLGKQFIKKFLEDSFVSQSVLPGSCDAFFLHLQGKPNSPYKGVSIGQISREDIAMRLTEMASPRASKLPQATATATTAEKPEVESPKPTEEREDVNHIQDVVEDYEGDTQCQDVEKPPTMHLPMAVRTFWTAPEPEILHVFNMEKYRTNT
ncbi:Hypothetical predicted protein [Mytilus galloprovincialis]|uniref:Uncharacterized protein n=1 Tax=Mytilus galloprovincialis TaxID=29158 RepID=A0A8B6HND8_MYTGA|nr:Hypothetical predicted protein [Mytilus galloprovincialis]